MEWLASVTTASAFAVVLWLCRGLIATRLKSSVSHEFNAKLEALKAELAAKQSQIDALRSGALSSMTARHNALFERRLSAAEELWEAVIGLAGAKGVAKTIAAIKYENALRVAERDPRTREFFERIGGSPVNFHQVSAEKVRPFISKLTWAYYHAYQSILVHSVLRMQLLRSGLNMPDIIDTVGVVSVVKAALPHQAGYIDQQGYEALPYLLDELECKILDALSEMMTSQEADKAVLEQAAAIVSAADKLVKESEKRLSQALSADKA